MLFRRSTALLLPTSATAAAMHATRSCLSKGKTVGSSSGTTAGTFMGKLKSAYAEMQLRKDHMLDEAEAWEEKKRQHIIRDSMREEFAEASGLDGDASSKRSQRPLRISENRRACPRSVLFVPGSKPRAMEKIHQLDADCFILDLEDSVGPSLKREAREHVKAFVTATVEAERKAREEAAKISGDAASSVVEPPHKRIVVRINSPDFDPANAMLDLELIGVLGGNIEGVAIPKVTPLTFSRIAEYVYPEHTLWAFFESPQSVLQAREICAQGVYAYAVMGYNDLAAELQLPPSSTSGDIKASVAKKEAPKNASGGETVAEGDSSDTKADATPSATKRPMGLYDGMSAQDEATLYMVGRLPLLHCSLEVIMCARANGMNVLDGVFNNPSDPVGFRRDLRHCRALGFNGKTLIYPSQIQPTNTAFLPTEAEVEWAHRVREAIAQAQGGVAVVDGKMIEDLHVRQAGRLVTLYESSLLEEKEGKSSGRDGGDASKQRSQPPPRRSTSSSTSK